MNTNIRSRRADEVWMQVFIRFVMEGMDFACQMADLSVDKWAARFSDEETLADIEANRARRNIGNTP